MSKNLNPGPGNYNIINPRLWPIPTMDQPIVVCFFKGADTCHSCGIFLYGDYYQNSSGKTNLCFQCFRKFYDPIRHLPCFYHKVRHCIAYHKHIDVENIVYHKTTSKRIRRLKIKEKIMWNKFGEMKDGKGKPT